MADIAKVKRNIQRMIDQKAPESDIDAYVASEGVTLDQLHGASTAPQARRGHASAMFMQGLTMGASDEIAGGIVGGLRTIYDPRTGEWFSGDLQGKYDEALADERKLLEDTRRDHPYASTALETAGGVAGALVPAGAVARGSGVAWKGVKGIGTGAALGGAYGFNTGEGGFEQRTQSAIPQAGIGAGVGFVAPGLGKLAGAAWNKLASVLNERGVGPQAIKKILTELQASGMTPQQAAQRLGELGPEGVLADVNPGMQVMTGATGTADTGAASLISQRLGGRLQGAQQRMAQDLDATLGTPRDPYTQMQANKAQRGAISPQYEDALTNAPQLPEHLGTTLQAQLTNPAAALGKRQFMLGIMDQIDDALMADTPELVARRLFDLRKNLDAQIVYDPRARFALSSADKANQEALIEARGAIDDVLKNRIPGFQEADEAFTPVAREQGAYEKGRRALRDDISVGEHRADMAGYSRGERRMSNAGMRYDIEQRLDRPRQNAGLTADRIMGSNAAQQKLEASIGRPGAQRLRRGINREETFLETSNLGDVRRNSRTAPLREATDRLWAKNGWVRQMVTDMIGGAGAGTAIGGVPGAVAGGLAAAGSNMRQRITSALTHKDGDLIRDTAERLTRRGSARDALVQELSDMAARLPRRARNVKMVEQLGAALLLGTTGQTAPSALQAGRAFGLVDR